MDRNVLELINNFKNRKKDEQEAVDLDLPFSFDTKIAPVDGDRASNDLFLKSPLLVESKENETRKKHQTQNTSLSFNFESKIEPVTSEPTFSLLSKIDPLTLDKTNKFEPNNDHGISINSENLKKTEKEENTPSSSHLKEKEKEKSLKSFSFNLSKPLEEKTDWLTDNDSIKLGESHRKKEKSIKNLSFNITKNNKVISLLNEDVKDKDKEKYTNTDSLSFENKIEREKSFKSLSSNIIKYNRIISLLSEDVKKGGKQEEPLNLNLTESLPSDAKFNEIQQKIREKERSIRSLSFNLVNKIKASNEITTKLETDLKKKEYAEENFSLTDDRVLEKGEKENKRKREEKEAVQTRFSLNLESKLNSLPGVIADENEIKAEITKEKKKRIKKPLEKIIKSLPPIKSKKNKTVAVDHFLVKESTNMIKYSSEKYEEQDLIVTLPTSTKIPLVSKDALTKDNLRNAEEKTFISVKKFSYI